MDNLPVVVIVVSVNMNETEFRKMNSRINPEEELI
tara:strand:+ start:320 stop:424 length:105 start_codon:yes stop_codon:yes gene_type:complete